MRTALACAVLTFAAALAVGGLLARAADRRSEAEARVEAVELALRSSRLVERQLAFVRSRAEEWASSRPWRARRGGGSWPDFQEAEHLPIHGAVLDDSGALLDACRHLRNGAPWGFERTPPALATGVGALYSVRNRPFLFASAPLPAHSGGRVLAGVEAEALVAVSGLDDLTRRGFAHELWVRELLSGERALVHGSTEPLGTDRVELPLAATGGSWAALSIATERRLPGAPPETVRGALALILALLAAAFVYELVRRPARLQVEIDARGAELAAAQRRVLHEIEQRQRMSDQISFNAIHDGLTRLPNLREFVNRIERSLGRVRTGGEAGFCVAVVGLDRFSSVNETLGEEHGDALLGQVAARLAESIRPGDTVARVGGDKFGLLLYGVDGAAVAQSSAERVADVMSEPFEQDDQTTYLTASLGLTLAQTGYEGARELFRHAEIAMYEAKAKRPGGSALFEPATGEKVASVLQLETDLRRGIERDEFELYYQPIVATTGGELKGMEVLIRWNHPLEGTIPPSRFLPLAEDLGLMSAINRWVLQRAAEQAGAWVRSYGESSFYLSFNATASDLEQESFCDYIGKVVSDAGLPRGAVGVEITESMILQDLTSAGARLGRLNEQGVMILLDDFGTGYSSLSYLHKLPIDMLKIDRSFIALLRDRERDREIVRAIIEMAGALRIKTIAEGIEDRETLAILQAMKCDAVQGYYFSQPVPAAAAEEWLGRSRGQQQPPRRAAS